ncbi:MULTISPECIES: hypothetical protein [Streptomyces]|uniref:hypothetical protein n=1 Tax=Streptomyces TaxID=1883 RepID=UPI000BF0175D|nr:hypothetical protein [Streptomyces sp. or20]
MTAPPTPRSLDGPSIILPAAFRAFLTLQEPACSAYTDACTHLPGRAFGDLAAHGSVIMLREDPAAYARDLFATTVRHPAGRIRIPAVCPVQYDVVLHHLADRTIDRTSETTGRHSENIRHILRTWAP